MAVAAEFWSQMSESGGCGQVLGRGPRGPGPGEAVMSMATPLH